MWVNRSTAKEPALLQVLLAGSYNSAVPTRNPPVTSTFPSASKVAVWLSRGVTIEAAAVQVTLFRWDGERGRFNASDTFAFARGVETKPTAIGAI